MCLKIRPHNSYVLWVRVYAYPFIHLIFTLKYVPWVRQCHAEKIYRDLHHKEKQYFKDESVHLQGSVSIQWYLGNKELFQRGISLVRFYGLSLGWNQSTPQNDVLLVSMIIRLSPSSTRHKPISHSFNVLPFGEIYGHLLRDKQRSWLVDRGEALWAICPVASECGDENKTTTERFL